MKRVLTAALLIPSVLYVVFLGHPYVFLAAVALVAFLCFHEFTGLVRLHGLDSAGPVGFAAGLIILAAPGPQPLVLTLVAMLAVVLALRAGDLARVLPSGAALVLGVLYVFGGWRSAIGLREISAHWLFFALALNWMGDTAAYCAGRAFGRHMLTPRLSPKKTWEGSVASIAVGAVFGTLYLPRFVMGVSLLEAGALSVVANIAGQLGDLVESAFKRGAGVKDSGTLLPGHGGMLDRVDSTLFALPVVYFWALRPWV
jgi:phosphatidate cytidylyltransferase